MPTLVTNEPMTWERLQEHPAFREFELSDEWRTWYEGDDPEDDLALLRRCAIDVGNVDSRAKVNLVVLDDLTTFVEFEISPVKGRFGTGCSPRTVYLQIDADPSSDNAPTDEIDDLSISECVASIRRFIAE
jgi:hypothetical protein